MGFPGKELLRATLCSALDAHYLYSWLHTGTHPSDRDAAVGPGRTSPHSRYRVRGQELEAALHQGVPPFRAGHWETSLGSLGARPRFGLFRLLLPAKVDHEGLDSLSHEDTCN